MTIVVVGAGAQGRIVADLLRAQSPEQAVEMVDDNPDLLGRTFNGARVTGTLDSLSGRDDVKAVVAVGHPLWRRRLAERLAGMGVAFTNILARSAEVMPSARLGSGCTLLSGSIVNSGCTVGDHVLINNQALVEHDSHLEDGTTICPGARVGGRVTVEKGAFIGSGAILLPRLTVGAGSIVAAGALVSKDVPPGVLVMGVPARQAKTVTSEFDWSRLL